jgi:hypothetical protein
MYTHTKSAVNDMLIDLSALCSPALLTTVLLVFSMADKTSWAAMVG